MVAIFFVYGLTVFGPGIPHPNVKPVLPASAPSLSRTRPTSPTSAPPVSAGPAINSWEIPAGFTANDLSPYFHKVRIGWVSAGWGNYPSRASIYASGLSGNANVTGWQIKTNNGGMFIPQAVNSYDPFGFSPETDIRLGNGEQVFFYGSASAIGRNLRLNKCIGYLDSGFRRFNPPLPMNCASPQDVNSLSNITAACRGYMQSLGGCQLPAPNPPIPITDYQCQSYLSSWNYDGCFQKHQTDPDFLSHEWWVWTGSQFFNSSHDRILLMDRDGKLVDEKSY